MVIAVSLLALAFGYKAFVDASKEKEGLKLLGQAIGIFVMILAFLSTLCGISYKMSKCMMMSKASYGMVEKSCPMVKKVCPVSGDSAS